MKYVLYLSLIFVKLFCSTLYGKEKARVTTDK